MRKQILFSFPFLFCLVVCAPLGTGVAGAQTVYPAPMTKTGQSHCYDNSGAFIDCTSTGQDGDLKKGLPWPNPRFQDNSDGTVMDHLTGLIWLKNAGCWGPKSWNDAISAANDLADGSCGLSDGSVPGNWRLPNIVELRSLINYDVHSPALPPIHPFVGTRADSYWSSTLYASNLAEAWRVDFTNGEVYFKPKISTYYLWPVRGGR